MDADPTPRLNNVADIVAKERDREYCPNPAGVRRRARTIPITRCRKENNPVPAVFRRMFRIRAKYYLAVCIHF